MVYCVDTKVLIGSLLLFSIFFLYYQMGHCCVVEGHGGGHGGGHGRGGGGGHVGRGGGYYGGDGGGGGYWYDYLPYPYINPYRVVPPAYYTPFTNPYFNTIPVSPWFY